MEKRKIEEDLRLGVTGDTFICQICVLCLQQPSQEYSLEGGFGEIHTLQTVPQLLKH